MGILSGKGNNNPDAQMSFMAHLEALRWHLVRAAIVMLVICGVAFYFSDVLFERVVFAPLSQDFPTYGTMCKVGKMLHAEEATCIKVDPTKLLQTLGASDQFSQYIWVCMLTGIILGFPYFLYEIWKFIRPALRTSEASPFRFFVLVGSLLFLIGVLFGYFILFPLSYNFLINFTITSKHIVTNNTLDDYISLITTMALVTGLVFELPIIVYFLTRIGIFTPKFMRKYRKHAVIIILILAAVITPSPDVYSQMVVFIPLWILYEISIFVSANVVKKYKLEQ